MAVPTRRTAYPQKAAARAEKRPRAQRWNAPLRMEAVHAACVGLCGALEPRQRRIIEARFGIVSGVPETLQAIGGRERVTRERVRQIERAALAALRGGRRLPLPPTVGAVCGGLTELLTRLGGVALLDTLLRYCVGGSGARDAAAITLVCAVAPEIVRVPATDRTREHWARADQPASAGIVPRVLDAAEKALAGKGVLTEAQFLSAVRAVVPPGLSDDDLRALLAIGERLVRTPFGEWGFRGLPETTPRTVGDKIYLILKRTGKPLHFRVLTDAINAVGFSGRPAQAQTVHNELIRRSDRYVLVGRGLYALRSWGYRPGTVADVVERILREVGGPVAKADLVARVLRERLVKRSTVILSLHDRRRFRLLPEDKVGLTRERPVRPTIGPSGLS